MREVDVVNNKVEVSLDTLITEVLDYLKSFTGVSVDNFHIGDNKVILDLSSDNSLDNIRVFKDRLNITDDYSISNSAVDKIKSLLYSLLKDNFSCDFNIKLQSIDNTNENMTHLTLVIKLVSIPYPIRISCHLDRDGGFTISYSVFGDRSLDEIWTSTGTSMPRFLDGLKHIEEYYNKKIKNIS